MGVLPNQLHGSTTFSNKITSYDLLSQRIKRMLGEPLVQVEISDPQMYEIIDTACEYFTKFAGYTDEFLIFRSDLYIPQYGLPLGRLINITPDLTGLQDVENFGSPLPPITEYNQTIGDGSSKEYIITHDFNDLTVIPQIFDSTTNQLVYPSITNISPNQIKIVFKNPIAINSYRVVVLNGNGVPAPRGSTFNPVTAPGWDPDRNAIRKVVDVYSFEEGSNTGVNTLFTIEHTIAQQAYFGHLLGNVGYDLVTWQTLKNWIDTRQKVLALIPFLRFNPDTQILKIIPEPSQNSVYYGLVGCKVQKPIKDIVSQLWVYRYAMALAKMTVGHARGKYSGTNLFGGQSVNHQDLMSQGLAERDKLEAEITTELIDREPVRFFIG